MRNPSGLNRLFDLEFVENKDRVCLFLVEDNQSLLGCALSTLKHTIRDLNQMMYSDKDQRFRSGAAELNNLEFE